MLKIVREAVAWLAKGAKVLTSESERYLKLLQVATDSMEGSDALLRVYAPKQNLLVARRNTLHV